MMGSGFEVVGPVLLHLGLEAGGSPPVDVLPTIVGEHLFGRLVFASRDAKHLQHVLSRVAAKEVGPDDEARIIIHEGDDVGVPSTQPEGEDVGLPHLVRGRSLEETGTDYVASGLGRRLDQSLLFKGLTDGLRAGLQEEYPLEQLGYPFDPPGRFFPFEFDDLLADRLGKLLPASATACGLQSLFSLLPVEPDPLVNGGETAPHLLGNKQLREALLKVQFDGA